jgi:hypothetical protein
MRAVMLAAVLSVACDACGDSTGPRPINGDGEELYPLDFDYPTRFDTRYV